jgi:hypothetical protein
MLRNLNESVRSWIRLLGEILLRKSKTHLNLSLLSPCTETLIKTSKNENIVHRSQSKHLYCPKSFMFLAHREFLRNLAQSSNPSETIPQGWQNIRSQKGRKFFFSIKLLPYPEKENLAERRRRSVKQYSRMSRKSSVRIFRTTQVHVFASM